MDTNQHSFGWQSHGKHTRSQRTCENIGEQNFPLGKFGFDKITISACGAILGPKFFTCSVARVCLTWLATPVMTRALIFIFFRIPTHIFDKIMTVHFITWLNKTANKLAVDYEPGIMHFD